MKKYIFWLLLLTLPLWSFTQKNGISVMYSYTEVGNITTKILHHHLYKSLYFNDYKDRFGFSLRHNFNYFKILEFIPNVELHFLRNKKLNMFAKKIDINATYAIKVYEYKKFSFLPNIGFGYSRFNIHNKKTSDYYFSHTYQGALFNLGIEIRYMLNDFMYLNTSFVNSYYEIFRGDKYINNENWSYHNNFLNFSIGIGFLNKDKENKQ